MTLSVYQLRTYLGASAKEIVQIRALFGDCDGDDFPTAECARALLMIRQGDKARDPITTEWKAAQLARKSGPVSELLGKLRKGMNRRVPPQ